MQLLSRAVLLFAVVGTDAAKKAPPGDPLLALTDETLEAALKEHPLMLLTIGMDQCEPCAQYERRMMAAGKEIRAQSKNRVTLAKLTVTSQNSPVLANIVQGQLTLPKLLIFREGEAMDFDGEPTKASMVEVMLREMSRETILTLKSVKQTERFLHLDSWSAQHADEEKPSRVVGFFPSNTSAAYQVFRDTARKLQGMISFGEIFDPALQKKFLGKPPRKSVIQVVKSDRKERTLTYGPRRHRHHRVQPRATACVPSAVSRSPPRLESCSHPRRRARRATSRAVGRYSLAVNRAGPYNGVVD